MNSEVVQSLINSPYDLNILIKFRLFCIENKVWNCDCEITYQQEFAKHKSFLDNEINEIKELYLAVRNGTI